MNRQLSAFKGLLSEWVLIKHENKIFGRGIQLKSVILTLLCQLENQNSIIELVAKCGIIFYNLNM